MRRFYSAIGVASCRRMSTHRRGGGHKDPFQYCTDVVKRGDYDGYLYSLLQGSKRRQAALAIRAFNVETAAIKDSVRGNSMPGRMRMQWWKDSIADVFAGEPPLQPVTLALADVVGRQKHHLTRRWFDRVLDARMADLEKTQPVTTQDMESYAENTASSLLYLSLEIAGIHAGTNVKGVEELGHTASHVGKAVGMCILLRSLGQPPPDGKVGFVESCALPAAVMRKFLLSHSVLQRGPKTEKEAHSLAECVFEVATAAKRHVDAAGDGLEATREKVGGALPAGAFAALLPGVRAAWYLEMLEICQFNPYDPRLRPRSPLGFQMRLGKSLFTEKFL